MGLFDFWRINGSDSQYLRKLINCGCNLWATHPSFCDNYGNNEGYQDIINSAITKQQYLELRHCVCTDYDANCNKEIKDIKIGVLPSLAKERIQLYDEMQIHMCQESKLLYKKGQTSLILYKNTLKEYYQSQSMVLEGKVKALQQELNQIYRLMLIRSTMIATTATRHNAFIRKYIEIPYASSILIAEETAWEKQLFKSSSYPRLTKNEITDSNKVRQVMDNCKEIVEEIRTTYTYENRINRLLNFYHWR